MTNSSELKKEWELEPDIHTFEISGDSWMRVKSHPNKRIDKKWNKRYGYHLRNITVHCVVYRVPEMKHLCGYVGFPKGHVYYKTHYDKLACDVHVHGGLTFSGFVNHHREGFKSELWYIGFDAAHFMDLSPGLEELLARLTPESVFDGLQIASAVEEFGFFSHNIYRNMEYMTDETTMLAKQLLLTHPIDPKGRAVWVNGLR